MNEQPRWLNVLFWLWMLALVLMPTQYAVTRLRDEGSGQQRWIVIWPYDTFAFSVAEGEDPGEAFLKALPYAPRLICISPTTLSRIQHRLNQFPFIGLADLLVALVFGMWFLLALKNRRQLKWCKLPPIAIWAFLGAALLSGVNAVSVRDWATECLQLFLYLLGGFTLAANVLSTETRVRQAVTALILVTVVVIGLGLWDYFQHIFAAPPAQEDPLMVRSTFTSRTVFGGYLALVLPLPLGLLLHSPGWVRKLGWGLLLVVGVLPIVTAGALVALFLTSLILAVWTAPRFPQGLLRVLVIVFIGVLVVFFLSERQAQYLWQSIALFQEDRVEEFLSAQATGSRGALDELTAKRYREWLATAKLLGYDRWLESWQEHLEARYYSGQVTNVEALPPERYVLPNIVVGVGAGENYQVNIGQFYDPLPNPPLEKMEPDTHNVYLLVASQMGLLGLFALLYLVFDFMSRTQRVRRAQIQGYPAALALGLWGSLLSFLLFGPWGTLLTRGTYLVLVTLLALIATLERLYVPPPPEPARRRKPEPTPEPPPEPLPLMGEEGEEPPEEIDQTLAEVESLRELLGDEEEVPREAEEDGGEEAAVELPAEDETAPKEAQGEGTISWLEDESGPEEKGPDDSPSPPTTPKG